MLIGFLGCPNSGKTTVAAKVYASLKDDGLLAEFIPEQARTYIAEKRKRKPIIELTDDDQNKIASAQTYAEFLFDESGTIVVTDSSTVNTGLYVNNPQNAECRFRTIVNYDILFLCPPIYEFFIDPNRVHSREQSLALHDKLMNYLTSNNIPILDPDNFDQAVFGKMGNIFRVNGNSDTRMRQALKVIHYAYFRNTDQTKDSSKG
jgi:nicotinamide riboside kinase